MATHDRTKLTKPSRLSIMLIGSASSDTMEEWTQKLSAKSGVKVDWHYYAGRAHVYCVTDSLVDHDTVIALIHRLGVPVYKDVIVDDFPRYMWLSPEGRMLDQVAAFLPGDDFAESSAAHCLNGLGRRKEAREAGLHDTSDLLL